MVRNLTPEMEEAIIAGKMTSGHAEWLLKIEDDKLREEYFRRILNKKLTLDDLKYDIYRMKPDSEKNKKELLLDIVEDEYAKDPAVRKLWRKSVVVRRSRGGDEIKIKFSGPFDLLDKYDVLSAPIRKAKKRFRTVMGRDARIP